MFTTKDVVEENIKTPPVKGCVCTYCTNQVIYGYSVRGHGSMDSHRLSGGDEHHNAENKARLALRSIVPQKAFAGYVSEPGGHVLWFQGPSGLWYASGRVGDTVGHYLNCYLEKRRQKVIQLCLPPRDYAVPLATIVMMHYLSIQTDEKDTWHRAAYFDIHKNRIPPEFKKVLPPQYLR